MSLQRWNKQQSAQIVGGLSTYTFPAIGEGYACTCSVSVPGATSGTQWFVYVSGALISSMFGAATCSGIYLGGGDYLTVSAPSLPAGVAVASGVLGLTGEIPPSSPISGGTPQALLGIGTIGAGFNTVVVTPADWAVGLIVANTVGPITAAANYATPTIPNSLVFLPTLLIEDPSGTLLWFIPLAGIGGQVLITIPAAPTITAYVSQTTVALTETTVAPAYTITVPNPGVGADWSYTLPQPARLGAMVGSLLASGAAANRFPNMVLGGIQVPLVMSAITASQLYSGTAYPGAAFAQLTYAYEACTAPLPNLLLLAGATIASATVNIQGGDQWEAISLTFTRI